MNCTINEKKKLVHVSDAAASADAQDVLATYSLGSCIAVSLYDPVRQIGGIMHCQLPDSEMDRAKAAQKPFMFADTGLKKLLELLIGMGASQSRLQVKIAGGANMDSGPKGFDIGKRNHLAVRKILWQKGLLITAEDVGGQSARNMYLRMSDGKVLIRSGGSEKLL